MGWEGAERRARSRGAGARSPVVCARAHRGLRGSAWRGQDSCPLAGAAAKGAAAQTPAWPPPANYRISRSAGSCLSKEMLPIVIKK